METTASLNLIPPKNVQKNVCNNGPFWFFIKKTWPDQLDKTNLKVNDLTFLLHPSKNQLKY